MHKIEIRLSDIVGVHKAILEFQELYSIPPFSSPNLEVLLPQALQRMMQKNMVVVYKIRDRYVCIGNCRFYRILHKVLPETTIVPVVLQTKRIVKRQLVGDYLCELFLLAAIHHISKDDVRRLFAIWRRIDFTDYQSPLQCTSEAAFMRTYRAPSGTRNN